MEVKLMKETNGMNRRQFMQTSLAASVGLVVGAKGLFQSTQVRKSEMKVGLYGITLLGIWFSGKANSPNLKVSLDV